MKANLCDFRCNVWGYVHHSEAGVRLYEGEPVLFQVPLYGQALTVASKGIKILFDFPRKEYLRAELGIAVYCVAELPKRRTCVILGPAFLHRVSYSGIGTHLHEDEPVLF